MSRKKGPDEVFCTSCGTPIKQQAEICPECGVRNEQAPSSKTAQGSTQSKVKHDPSQYETTVSDTWYYGVVIAVGLWIISLATIDVLVGATETLMSLLALVAWILMPVSIYFDSDYIRANGEWNPNTTAWVIAAIIPLINIATGAFYLYRRHEVLGEP